MKKYILLIIIFTASSCANYSLKKAIVYGGLSGAATGATTGALLSPNQESKLANTLVWGGILGLIGAGLGWYMWQDDIDNKPLKNMINDDNGINLSDPNAVYDLPSVPIPKNLEGKFPQSKVYEFVVPEQRSADGKYLIEEHKKWVISN